MGIGLEAREGAEAARFDLHRIERALLDRRDARVGLVPETAVTGIVTV